VGGASCIVHFNALVTFSAVPTAAADLPKFDAQMRQFWSAVATDTVLDLPDQWTAICDTLGKQTWTAADRTKLWDWAQKLWAGIPYS
jgi:hypothetical protein